MSGRTSWPVELAVEVFKRNSHPLEPIPTDLEPQLTSFEGVKAVLFDLYGTLFVSASGEVGTTRQLARQSAFIESLAAIGIKCDDHVGEYLHLFFDTIERRHEQGRQQGIEYPEVQYPEIWIEVLQQLRQRGLVSANVDEQLAVQLTVEYESRANPVWPMPGAAEMLTRLKQGGLKLGIVSNAQFYTRALFPAFFGKSAEQCGFDPLLQVYSFELGHAKPGIEIYRVAAERLGQLGIVAREAVYVGNDMLNDIYPAAQVGMRTVLFAGDKRSLRLREDDPRIGNCRPEAVITQLEQLVDCVVSQ